MGELSTRANIPGSAATPEMTGDNRKMILKKSAAPAKPEIP
jgi:hypothetical protein